MTSSASTYQLSRSINFLANGMNDEVMDIEAKHLPLPAYSFDLVYTSEVIEHCVNTPAFLGATHAILKPRGVLRLLPPNSAFWPYRLIGLAGRTLGECEHARQVRFFSKRSCRGLSAKPASNCLRFRGTTCIRCLVAELLIRWNRHFKWSDFKMNPRFSLGSYFWFVERVDSNASPLWSDTLIVKVRKHRRYGRGASQPAIQRVPRQAHRCRKAQARRPHRRRAKTLHHLQRHPYEINSHVSQKSLTAKTVAHFCPTIGRFHSAPATVSI